MNKLFSFGVNATVFGSLTDMKCERGVLAKRKEFSVYTIAKQFECGGNSFSLK